MFGIFVVASPAAAKHGTAGLKEKTKAEILAVACPFRPSLTSTDRFTEAPLHICPQQRRQVRATGREHSPDTEWGRQWGQRLPRARNLLDTIVILWLSL